jgi:hypothetical protein
MAPVVTDFQETALVKRYLAAVTSDTNAATLPVQAGIG